MDIRKWVASNPDSRYDVVMHFAGEVGGRQNIETNYFNMIQNIDIDRQLFEWAIDHTAHLIYPSSSAVYPIEFQTNITPTKLHEGMISFSQNVIGVSDHLYGWYKLTAERMVWEMSKLPTCPHITIFRPFSGYGPTQSLDYPMPRLINRILANTDGIIDVWGDGQQSRDFVYIDDILSIYDWSINNPCTNVINIGSGVGISFEELIHKIGRISGKPDLCINPLLDKPVGVIQRVANTDKMKSVGLVTNTNIDDGIKLMMQ